MKKKTSKYDAAQMEFEMAKDNLESAIARFDTAAVTLAETEPEQCSEVLDESKKMRKAINRMVRHLATQSYKNDFRATWIDVYKMMGRIFHYNPASKCVSHTKPHLDICEEDGNLDKLLKVVQAMVANEAEEARC